MSRIEITLTSTNQIMVAGALVLASAALWLTVTAVAAPTSSFSAAELILLAGSIAGSCWMVSARWPALVPSVVICVAAGAFILDPKSVLRYSPVQGPFGYANATAAFYAQAVIAALMLMVAGRTLLVRTAGGVAALAFGSLVITTRSWTVLLLLPALVCVAIVLGRSRGSQAVVVVCGSLFVLVLVTTVILGAWGGGSGGDRVDRLVRATISQQRVALWHDALTITADHPVLGVGPGRFASVSETASSDVDLRWAHNEFLQTSAESGLIGFALVVGIFLWGFFALWAGPTHFVTGLAAVALALLGIHASIDHVLRVPEVAFIGAAVLGVGLGAPLALQTRARVSRTDLPEREGAA